jgi:Tol biopolymer transport system component
VTHIVKRTLLAVSAMAFAFGVLATVSVPAALAADTYQIRLVATPVEDAAPSFVSPFGDFLAWTGTYNGTAKMYVYDLVSGKNTYINPGNSGSYYNPATEGTYVVFQGAASGGYDDIYLYDRDSKETQPISWLGLDGDRNDWNPRIADGRVVWEKDTADPATGSGIYLYDIASRTTTEVLSGPEYRDPDISGSYLVCVKDTPSETGPNSSQIILYNLDTTETTILAGDDGTKNCEHPRIDGNRVVYSSGDVWTQASSTSWTTSYQVYLYDINDTTTTKLTDDMAGNLNPAIGGDLMVWQTWTPSTVRACNLTTGNIFDISLHGDAVREPEVDGTRVAWWGSKGLYYAVPSGEAMMFPDVPSGQHYLEAIEGAAGLGIVKGYGDLNFGPNDWLIHQQFAEMIDLAMGYPVTDDDTYDFTDKPPIVHLTGVLYPFHYVSAAALRGVVVTYSDGTYRPLYRERGKEAVASLIVAAGDLLVEPPADFTGTLTNADALVTYNLWKAEYNGLLDNIVGPDGTLATWDPEAPATRAEIAQLLWNLYQKVHP